MNLKTLIRTKCTLAALALCAVPGAACADWPATGIDLLQWCSPVASPSNKQLCKTYLDGGLSVHEWRSEILLPKSKSFWCFPQNMSVDEIALVVHRHITGLAPDVQKGWAWPLAEAAFMRNFPCKK